MAGKYWVKRNIRVYKGNVGQKIMYNNNDNGKR